MSKASQRILRAFLDLYLQGHSHQASHKGRRLILRISTTSHLPKITRPSSCLTISKGVGRGLNRKSHPALVSLARTVLSHTNMPATQAEMFACCNMEKVSPHIATGLTVEEHNFFSWQVPYPPASQHLHAKDSHNLVQNWQGWVKTLRKANS